MKVIIEQMPSAEAVLTALGEVMLNHAKETAPLSETGCGDPGERNAGAVLP